MQITQFVLILVFCYHNSICALEDVAVPGDVPEQDGDQPEAADQDTAARPDAAKLHPKPFLCDHPYSRDSKVLIIGSGISGLGAAQKLHQHGFHNLKILEATGRIGGRIWTEKFAKGLVEIGAQWIHGPSSENAVFNMSSQYNLLGPDVVIEESEHLDLWGHLKYIPVTYSNTGKKIPPEMTRGVEKLFLSWVEKAEGFTQNKSIPEASVGDFLKQEIAKSSQEWDKDTVDEKMGLLSVLFKMYCSLFGTHSMDYVALAPLGEYKDLPGLDRTFPRGFSSLVNNIRSSLPDDTVLLNKVVKTIHWSRSFQGGDSHAYPVQVECEDGDTFVADHVIVTVPLGFLKEQTTSFLEPPFPPHKVQAIKNLGFGTVNKLILEFEQPFWEPDCHYIQLVWEGESPLVKTQRDLSHDWVKKIAVFMVLKEPEQSGNVLLGFITGEEAEFMETLTDEVVLTQITALLRQFTGNPNIPRPISIRRSRWKSEKYTRGSYSYVAVGSSGDDRDFLAQPLPEEKDAAKPLQVLFAGEATHRYFYATTHGALSSGWREAERLIGQCTGPDPSLTKAKP